MSPERPPHSLPFVSVVIPAKNAEATLGQLFRALDAQTYPRDRYEVILVDNGSTDRTVRTAKAHADTVLLDPTKSQFRAINIGVRKAKGEIIALTDADCNPVDRWIEEGVHGLLAEQADLAGGEIVIVRSNPRSAAEACDACTFLQQEDLVRRRGGICGANIFVRKSVFEQLGGMMEDAVSESDLAFGQKAVQQGCKLIFLPKAAIRHPGRGFRALLRKSVRIGEGKGSRLRSAQESAATHAWPSGVGMRSRVVLNLSPLHFRRQWNNRGIQGSWILFFRAWLCCYLVMLFGLWGTLRGLLYRTPPQWHHNNAALEERQ